MNKFFTMIIRHWSKSPLKVLMTLLSVALGTGIIILSLSADSILKEKAVDQLDKNGITAYVSNGYWNSDGTIERNRPPEWDQTIMDLIISDSGFVKDAAIIYDPHINELRAGDTSYSMRSVIGTDTSYFDIFDLQIISGNPMSEEDINMGSKKIWISEDLAVTLFGSSSEAIGQLVQPPGSTFSRGPGSRNRERNLIVNYKVTGIYATPGEVARRSYGIGDALLPYTSLLPSTSNSSMMMNFMAGNIVVSAETSSFDKLSSDVASVIAGNFGDDVDVVVWEGTPEGTSEYMNELRQAVSIFTVSVNILGLVLLITSSLGIFSIMVVEALARQKSIALERALGASKMDVVREFWGWSVMLSLTGAVAGIILALALNKPVLGTMAPLLGELGSDFSSAIGIKPLAVLGGTFLTLLCGGVLGLLPAFTAVKGNIADTLREG